MWVCEVYNQKVYLDALGSGEVTAVMKVRIVVTAAMVVSRVSECESESETESDECECECECECERVCELECVSESECECGCE